MDAPGDDEVAEADVLGVPDAPGEPDDEQPAKVATTTSGATIDQLRRLRVRSRMTALLRRPDGALRSPGGPGSVYGLRRRTPRRLREAPVLPARREPYDH